VLIALSLAGCATMGSKGNVDVVRIDADGTAYLNEEQIPVASLSDSFLKDEVIIEADRSTPYDKVVPILEETRKAGISKVSFKTQEKKK